MTLTPTEETVKAYLDSQGTHAAPTAMEISEHTGYPISTVYVALKAIGAIRTKRGKNQFGYVLPDAPDVEFLSVTEHLGTVDGRPWRAVAQTTLRVAAEASIVDTLTAEEYAEGFTNLGRRFLELAAHAAAVKDSPEWKITLGFTPDTEKE